MIALSLAFTNAAGKGSVTNINVIKSAMNLKINPVSDDLWQDKVRVTGTIDTSGYKVWVNGIAAADTGGGTWQADNVPTTPGGTAVVQVRAIPNSDNSGNGSGGSGGAGATYAIPGNPGSSSAVDADSQTDKGWQLFLGHYKGVSPGLTVYVRRS